MNKSLFLIAAALVFVCCQAAAAQTPGPPNSTDARDTLDDGVKGRSVEMERVKRDADRDATRPDKAAEMNFAQIKEDFEQIQMVFDRDVVTTYQKSNPINYKLISDGSSEIKSRSTRLRSNLFPQVKQKKGKDKKEETAPAVAATTAAPTDVKSLIMSLNGAIANFVASPIFQNSKVIDPKESEKAQIELDTVISLSSALSQEAAKMK